MMIMHKSNTVDSMIEQKKICIITTIDLSLYYFFPGFIKLLQDEGFHVTAICADTKNGEIIAKLRDLGAEVKVVNMRRNISPIHDLKTLRELYGIFRREQFDLIHYNTPKAALLSSIAGRLVGHKSLLYTLRGLGYQTFNGPKRFIGKMCEWVALAFATRVITISPSLREETINEGLARADKLEMIGIGSSKGVDCDAFRLSDELRAAATAIRSRNGILEDDVLIGFAGRFTPDKGLDELVSAFTDLHSKNPGLHLMFIGENDSRIPISEELQDRCKQHSNIHLVGYQDDVASYLAALDIFVLPSHREGFGNVLIEAAAVRTAVVSSNINGARDALVNDETGLLFEVKNTDSLRKTLGRLIEDRSLRERLAANGEAWVHQNFDRKSIWKKLIALYREMIEEDNN